MEDERLVSQESVDLEAWNRHALNRDRYKMLSMIPLLAESEVSPDGRADPSAVFSVRHEDQRLFPRFQFADDGRPYPELKAILERLPDEEGWDRLAWFLPPTKASPEQRQLKSGRTTDHESSRPQASSTGGSVCEGRAPCSTPAASRVGSESIGILSDGASGKLRGTLWLSVATPTTESPPALISKHMVTYADANAHRSLLSTPYLSSACTSMPLR